jgi:hypothetical protein
MSMPMDRNMNIYMDVLDGHGHGHGQQNGNRRKYVPV